MDKDVSDAFTNISRQITALSVQVGRLEQVNEDCEKAVETKQKKLTATLGVWRIAISLIGVSVLVLQVVGIIK